MKTLFYGGSVLPMEGPERAQALLIEDGRVRAAGALEDVDVYKRQVHGRDHLAVGGLDLLLDADIQLDTGPLWKLSGKLGVQTVDPLYNDHILGAQLIAPQLPLRAAQGEIIGGHRELPGGDDVQKLSLIHISNPRTVR